MAEQSGWWTDLPGLWARAWDRLAEGAADRGADTRRVAFATCGLDGAPEVRTVALRAADGTAATVAIFTDTETQKIAELTAEPRASLMAWVPEDSLQIRLRLDMTVVTGAALDPIWAPLSDGQRLNYGGWPLPGREMAAAEDYGKVITRARFAVLEGQVREVDLVHLGEPLHRRAKYGAADGFRGRWIAP